MKLIVFILFASSIAGAVVGCGSKSDTAERDVPSQSASTFKATPEQIATLKALTPKKAKKADQE